MILGTGIDIIEIDRVRRAHRRFGERFLRRLFTDRESAYCLAKSDPYPSLAARFAAKEAALKAFGRGYGGRWKWTLLEVMREDSGKPFLTFSGVFQRLAAERGLTAAHLSLAHDRGRAVAAVVLEGRS